MNHCYFYHYIIYWTWRRVEYFDWFFLSSTVASWCAPNALFYNIVEITIWWRTQQTSIVRWCDILYNLIEQMESELELILPFQKSNLAPWVVFAKFHLMFYFYTKPFHVISSSLVQKTSMNAFQCSVLWETSRSVRRWIIERKKHVLKHINFLLAQCIPFIPF